MPEGSTSDAVPATPHGKGQPARCLGSRPRLSAGDSAGPPSRKARHDCFGRRAMMASGRPCDRVRGNPNAPLPAAAPSLGRQPDRALSEVGATKAIAHRGNRRVGLCAL
jgi:hypothetical protein